MTSIVNKASRPWRLGWGSVFTLLVCFFWAPAPGFASAWLEPKGEAQLITTFTDHSSSGRFDDKGNPVVPDYQRYELASYAEYGLTDWLTLGVEPRYQWARSGSSVSSQASQGMGDIDVFARVPLSRLGSWVTSVQGTAILGTAYDQTRRPAPGTGENAYELRLLAGRNLGSNGSYVDFESGYRVGENGVADQFRFDVSLGLKPWHRWLLLEQMFLTKSVGDSDGVPGHAYDLVKLQSSLVYSLTQRLGVQLGYERDVAGAAVGLGNTGLVALWARF